MVRLNQISKRVIGSIEILWHRCLNEPIQVAHLGPVLLQKVLDGVISRLNFLLYGMRYQIRSQQVLFDILLMSLVGMHMAHHITHALRLCGQVLLHRWLLGSLTVGAEVYLVGCTAFKREIVLTVHHLVLLLVPHLLLALWVVGEHLLKMVILFVAAEVVVDGELRLDHRTLHEFLRLA